MSLETHNPEALREALLNLDRLRELEKTARLQMEALVNGLQVLNECQSANDMYREILQCLRNVIKFDSAAILIEESDGFLSTAVASDARLQFRHLPVKGVFERCLKGRATVLTQLTKVPDWPDLQTLIADSSSDVTHDSIPLQSALLVALPALDTRMILLCASENSSELKRRELELLKSFTPLATQAVRRAVEMEKLNYLVNTLDHQAHFDLLTGLPNRTFLEHKLNALVLSDETVTVMFLDLDNFKTINDTFGHAVGDILLSEIAFRMSAVVGLNDTVARMGGDEFAMIIRSRKTEKDVIGLCESLLTAISKPLFIHNGRIVPSASIGVLYATDAQYASQVKMQMADIAMYNAKRNGRNQFCFFNAAMKAEVQMEFDIESLLPLAIRQEQFHLVYQPIICADLMICNRVEVLVRWGEESNKVYGPHQFIPIAEKTGHIVELGKWIVKQSLLELRPWLAQSQDNTLSINISQLELQRIEFANEFIQLVTEANIDGQQIELELSENIVANCIDNIILENINNLNDKGIRFAFDDFGTGSSSLVHLQKFPGTCLKIDKSFIDTIEVSEQQQRLVAGMIDFAHHIGMEVVVEGVENNEQLDIVTDIGTDYIQGFLLAKPARVSETMKFLDNFDRSNRQDKALASGF